MSLLYALFKKMYYSYTKDGQKTTFLLSEHLEQLKVTMIYLGVFTLKCATRFHNIKRELICYRGCPKDVTLNVVVKNSKGIQDYYAALSLQFEGAYSLVGRESILM